MNETSQETPIGETSQKEQASGGGKVPASQDTIEVITTQVAQILDISEIVMHISGVYKTIAKKDLENYQKLPRWKRALFEACPRCARVLKRIRWFFD